ncbi:TPA: minor capsid protein [Enterococcus faecalis]|nr:minor capsid protein [Enterococcus faecalis]
MIQKSKKFSYWEQRNLNQEKKVNNDAKAIEQIIVSVYRQAQAYLTKKAGELFRRAKRRTGMDEKETRALLNQTVQLDELVELRKLAVDISNSELQKAAKKRLNALAFKERITRAEALKAKSYLVSKQIADVQLDKTTDFFIDVIHDSYKEATAESIILQTQKGAKDYVAVESWNKGEYQFTELSTKYTKNILNSHWHGSNYSKRIWGDTEALAKRLEELFTVESMTGMSEFEMAQAIASEFDRSIGVARRLIHTEANYMANQSKLKVWQDRGVKYYRLLAVLDLRTSEICQKMDGKVFLVSEAVVNGANGNYPPFHPWCRTVAVAWIDECSLTRKRKANDPISNEIMMIEQREKYDDWMNKLKEKYSDAEIRNQKLKIRKSMYNSKK